MAKRGRNANWIEDVPSELRKQINDALDCEESPTDLHERLSLSPHCSLRALQAYARSRRPRVQIKAAGELVRALVQDRTDLSDVQCIALSRVVEAIMLPGIKPTAIASLAREVNEFERMTLLGAKDARAEELHTLKLRIASLKVDMETRAAEAGKPGAGRSPAEAYAEMARMLDDLITKRKRVSEA